MEYRASDRSRITGYRRLISDSVQNSGDHGNMLAEIYNLEREAYFSVLRAFKAQSDVISWEREDLIIDLRKELRISEDEHKAILARVKNDVLINTLREAGGAEQGVILSMHHTIPPSTSGGKGYSSVVGKKVWTKWPGEEKFTAAVITRYNSQDGRHELVYDINTPNETYEWVRFSEIPANYIRWESGDSGKFYHGIHCGRGRGLRGSSSQGLTLTAGRERGSAKCQSKNEYIPLQNSKFSDHFEIYLTDTLVKEVDKVLNLNPPDLVEVCMTKKRVKEQEQALIDAIAKLDAVSERGKYI